MFNGLGMNLSNLPRLSDAKTRSITPENFTGEKGMGAMSENGPARSAARDLGRGWKVSPYVVIAPGEIFTMADIEGPGAVQHIWLTPSGKWRQAILRIYWDECEAPSVECPIGDFFASACQGAYGQVSSLAVCVNPGSGLNCYWEMPFRKRARFTLENRSAEPFTLYYQIDYVLTEIPEDCAWFHAQFRRVNPLSYKEVYAILDGIRGKGQYVGTCMLWGANGKGWWGEGEIKFYLDGDTEFPTICGTGTEDYFCGSYNFEVHGRYTEFTGPYSGMPKVIRSPRKPLRRFSLYRWHIRDPIRFESSLKVTIQALGWQKGGRYLPLQDDIASVAFWYQTLPAAPFPALPAERKG